MEPLTNNEDGVEKIDSFLEKETEMNGTSRADFLKKIGGFALLSAIPFATSAKSKSVKIRTGKKGAQWGFIIDLKRCVAGKACVVACKTENKTPPGVFYNRFIEEEKGTYPKTTFNAYTHPCMHCDNPPCIPVCPNNATTLLNDPNNATFKRDDGIVVTNYDKCVGAGDCVKACPYGARVIDVGKNYIADPKNPFNLIPSSEFNAKYGVRDVEKEKAPVTLSRKCMLCLHLQDENGEYREPTACSRTCMARAIHFGNLKDPNAKCLVTGDNLQELLKTRKHYRLKEEKGTNPNVYYLT